MNDKIPYFYKERELSSKKETLGFRIDKNLKMELEKHLKDKYGDNGVTIGMNKIVLDYMNNTPLVRTNIPILISLAVPKNDEQIYNLTIDDFSNIEYDDDKKDKLKILDYRIIDTISDNVFKERIPFYDIDKNIMMWNVIGYDESVEDFTSDDRFFKYHLNSECEHTKEKFNEKIGMERNSFYDIDDVYIIHFPLNNFLDSFSDGEFGYDGKHYGAISYTIDDIKYNIIIEFKLKDLDKLDYSCYLVTDEIFDDILKKRNKELYKNYKLIDYLNLDDGIKELSIEVNELQREYEIKLSLYNELLKNKKENLEKLTKEIEDEIESSDDWEL